MVKHFFFKKGGQKKKKLKNLFKTEEFNWEIINKKKLIKIIVQSTKIIKLII